MDWLAILSGAIDGAALALVVIAVFFGYRAIAAARRDENSLAEMERQDKFGSFALLAALLSAALIAIGQYAF